MRWSPWLRSVQKLVADPRHVNSFADLKIPAAVSARLPAHADAPLPVQKKMLVLNRSGYSVMARSVAGSGKSTAAILAMASAPPVTGGITNLVLVPTPVLANQYAESLRSFAEGTDTQTIRELYRTGEISEDEQQYRAVKQGVPTTLIATPTRLLDYLTHAPSLVPLENLRQLVVDELDMFQKERDSTNPLEIALEYILKRTNPVITLMSSLDTKLQFSKLPQLLEEASEKRNMVEVNVQPLGPLRTKVRVVGIDGHDLDITNVDQTGSSGTPDKPSPGTPKLESYGDALRNVWKGSGIVVVPGAVSVKGFQEYAEKRFGFEPLIVHSGDLAGINISDLENLYILSWDTSFNLRKLAWTLRGSDPNIIIGLVDGNADLARLVASEISSL